MPPLLYPTSFQFLQVNHSRWVLIALALKRYVSRGLRLPARVRRTREDGCGLARRVNPNIGYLDAFSTIQVFKVHIAI